MDSILEKIEKVLELARRGGTQAEAETALQLAHQLLAKHNLTLDQVESAKAKREDYFFDSGLEASRYVTWKDHIYSAVASLYFCKHAKALLNDGRAFHTIIGKQSNIQVVKFVAAYVIETGERLAIEAESARTSESKFYANSKRFRNSFKKGFAQTIHFRVQTEIERAKQGQVVDAETGKELILAPLYDQTEAEIDALLKRNNVNIERPKQRTVYVNAEAYENGRAAAETVSLRADLLGE